MDCRPADLLAWRFRAPNEIRSKTPHPIPNWFRISIFALRVDSPRLLPMLVDEPLDVPSRADLDMVRDAEAAERDAVAEPDVQGDDVARLFLRTARVDRRSPAAPHD